MNYRDRLECAAAVRTIRPKARWESEDCDWEVKEAGKAEENDMNRVELQRILVYLNIGLAIAHDRGGLDWAL